MGDLVFTECVPMFTVAIRAANFYREAFGFFGGREEAQETRKKGNAGYPLLPPA
jgi:hypothetical protein